MQTLKEHLTVNVKGLFNSEVRSRYQERNLERLQSIGKSFPANRKIMLPSYNNSQLIVKNKFVKVSNEEIQEISPEGIITLYSGLKFPLPEKGIIFYGEFGAIGYYKLGFVIPKKYLNRFI